MALRLDQQVTFARLASGNNLMQVPRDIAVELIRKYTIVYDKFIGNALYTLRSVGNTGQISFMDFVPPKHVLQARLNACQFIPKGRIGVRQTALNLGNLELNMSQCPDAFWGGPWERIFGTGVDINYLLASPEGKAIVDELMRLIFTGTGNSIHESAEFGQHPIIDIADAAGWYPVDALEWSDYKGNQAPVGGRITNVDALKGNGLDQYNVDISGYYNGTTAAFTGDWFDLLNLIINSRTSEMTIAEDQNGGEIKGIIEMDQVTFNAGKAQLLDRYLNIPQMWQFFMTGVTGELRATNYLTYQGYVIKPNSEWSAFDAITGTRTRRVLMSYPGVHGIGFDIPVLDEYNMGLKMEQSVLLRDKGRIDVLGNLKLGTLIIDTNMVVNGSKTFFPPFAA